MLYPLVVPLEFGLDTNVFFLALQNPFFGWLLQNPNETMIQRQERWETLKKRGANLDPIIQNMLDHGSYVWIN